MGTSKDLLNQEVTVLDNVINKLQVYMDQNGQTLYGLASTMGFAYQPFYRLMTKKHLPTLNSLSIIAAHFNCTVSELIHEDVFMDIDCFNSFDDVIGTINPSKIRIYIPYNNFLPLIHNNFFAMKAAYPELNGDHKNSDMPIVNCRDTVFYKIDNISIDGIFLVNFKSKNILLEVLSISSKFIIAILDGKETKIDISSIKPIAQFFSYLTLVNKSQPIIVGVTK
ncbi:MAG: hypothetical protein K0R49_1270 [Burkholderiales bacterium]|jgi:hypothetical protein|nr:hypothetical protein [Burkholderiales bacterium]